MPSIAPRPRGHGLDRGDLRLREHGQQLEQALLAGPQQLVAPVHRRPERLLALGQVARPAAQEAQPVAQAIPQDLGREQAQVRRGELDRQGQAVQPAADLGDCRGVVVGQLEVRGGPTRARSTNSWTASNSPIRRAAATRPTGRRRPSGGTG